MSTKNFFRKFSLLLMIVTVLSSVSFGFQASAVEVSQSTNFATDPSYNIGGRQNGAANIEIFWDSPNDPNDIDNSFGLFMKKGTDFTNGDLIIAIDPIPVEVDRELPDTQYSYFFNDLDPGTYYFKLSMGDYDYDAKLWNSHGSPYSGTVSYTVGAEEEGTGGCTHSVVQNDEKFTIELLGSDGEKNADCRFIESENEVSYEYEVVSGEAKLIGMTEYTLTFDGTLEGVIHLATYLPTYYSEEFYINPYGIDSTPGVENFSITKYEVLPHPFFGTKGYGELIEGTKYESGYYEVHFYTDYEPKIDEYFSVMCTYEVEGGSQGSSVPGMPMVIHPLPADTSFIDCKMLLRSYTQSFDDIVSSNTFLFTTPGEDEWAQLMQEAKQIPPAGYEDEVLTVFDFYDNPFPDTNITTLTGQAAAELYRRAVIGGFPDGEFKGKKDVNRAELAKFLLLARYGEVSTDVKNNGQFPDVLEGEWYVPFVVVAANKEIITGHPDGTFRPADGVNIAEFLKMLSETFDLETDLPFSWTDVDGSEWYAQFVGIAEKYDLFPDKSTILNPSSTMTRDQVAVAIYQYLANR